MGSESYIFGTNRTRTVCEVLRDINDQFQGDSEDDKAARDLVVNGMLIAKAMVGILGDFRRGKETESISVWLFEDNTAEHITKAHAIRDNPDYKVGRKYN